MIHSIVAKWAFDKAGKRKSATFCCPQCHFEQTAAVQEVNTPIFCEKCGSEIPLRHPVKRRETKRKSEK